MDTNYKLDITIKNIDENQARQIAQFLKVMQYLGIIGASRWLLFYSDGDGAFRPQIYLDGKDLSKISGDIGYGKWTKNNELGEIYKVDCDS